MEILLHVLVNAKNGDSHLQSGDDVHHKRGFTVVERKEIAFPVSQDISELDEWEPFRLIVALVVGFLVTILINPISSGRTVRN